MIQFVELVSMDCWKKVETKTERMMAVVDVEDNIDLLTLYQVLLAPVSRHSSVKND